MGKPVLASNTLNKNDLIVIAGAGGFIAGALTKRFHDQGFTRIRAVDRKPLTEWYRRTPGVECLTMNLSEPANCVRACEGAAEVYCLAADMGGMGFIEKFRIECLRSVLVNTHMVEAAWRAGAQRYFFSSSACAYNTRLQQTTETRPLKESDAYPAFAERGYGWEKLFSEMVCQEYWAERRFRTQIARFHNCYGPWGTWDGGREKAPAALSRKVIEAKDQGQKWIEVWGDGSQARSYMYVDDIVEGIDRITHCDELTATPINLGSTELLSVNQILDAIEAVAGVKLERRYNPNAPKGVVGRNSDNTMIKKVLGWEPSIPFKKGIKPTYEWIEQQYFAKKSGKRPAA